MNKDSSLRNNRNAYTFKCKMPMHLIDYKLQGLLHTYLVVTLVSKQLFFNIAVSVLGNVSF